ncbi:hypothetical protein [Deinococcus kurensis]|uniref:hypothetical protein n=1 Tax=Deinococcus kurensis TaxID=2662757 RepID=UPI0012D2EF96|nr:hypothetical protein [Deinococcus kurensis]
MTMHEFQENLYPTLSTAHFDLMTEVLTAARSPLGPSLAAQRKGAERLQTVRLWNKERDEALVALHAAQIAAQDAGEGGRADDLDDIQTVLLRSAWVEAELDNGLRAREVMQAQGMAQGAFRGDSSLLGMHLKPVGMQTSGGVVAFITEPEQVLLLELHSGEWQFARIMAPLGEPVYVTVNGQAMSLGSAVREVYEVTFPLMRYDPRMEGELQEAVQEAQATMRDVTLDDMDRLDAAFLLAAAGKGRVDEDEDGTGMWSWVDGKGVTSGGSFHSQHEALLDLGRHLSQ